MAGYLRFLLEIIALRGNKSPAPQFNALKGGELNPKRLKSIGIFLPFYIFFNSAFYSRMTSMDIINNSMNTAGYVRSFVVYGYFAVFTDK
jgi:hypothetical protein